MLMPGQELVCYIIASCKCSIKGTTRPFMYMRAVLKLGALSVL